MTRVGLRGFCLCYALSGLRFFFGFLPGALPRAGMLCPFGAFVVAETCENRRGSAHSFGVLNPGLVNPGLNGLETACGGD